MGLFGGSAPKEGDVAPNFTATDTDGRVWQLSEMVKTGTAVLAFFPKAFTPG